MPLIQKLYQCQLETEQLSKIAKAALGTVNPKKQMIYEDVLLETNIRHVCFGDAADAEVSQLDDFVMKESNKEKASLFFLRSHEFITLNPTFCYHFLMLNKKSSKFLG